MVVLIKKTVLIEGGIKRAIFFPPLLNRGVQSNNEEKNIFFVSFDLHISFQ
jgi:hypothetical protein